MTSTAEHGRLASLTSLRAGAALLVFGYHAGLYLDWAPAQDHLSQAYTGVGFFFVLSGFVLTWAHRPGSWTAFYGRRVARVVPSHLVMALIVTVAMLPGGDLSVLTLVLNLLLLQAWVPSNDIAYGINGVSWSLSCELFFYAVLPVVVMLLRRRTPGQQLMLAGGWLAACTLVAWSGLALPRLASVFSSVTGGGSFEVFATTNPALRSGEFVLGVVAALVVRRRTWRLPLRAALAVLTLSWTVVEVWSPQLPASNHLLALPFAMVIASAATRDLHGTRSRLHVRWLVYAGELSFAFYLVHEQVVLAVRELPLSAGAQTGLALLLGAAAAAVLHHAVERPCQRALLRRLPGGATRGEAAAGVVT